MDCVLGEAEHRDWQKITHFSRVDTSTVRYASTRAKLFDFLLFSSTITISD